MITFKFQKTENAVFVSHIDILRMTNRTIRRAGVPVNYSQGFNPHMLINLSQPLPLGIASYSEWATAQTDFEDEKKFIELYNKFCPKGFLAIQAFITQKKPNIAGKVTASDYYIENVMAYEHKEKIEIVNKGSYVIQAKTKKGLIDKDISSLIYKIKVDKQGIYVMLAFGNINLRIDNLAQKFNEDFNLEIKHNEIVRLNQYVNKNQEFILVEDYMKEVE